MPHRTICANAAVSKKDSQNQIVLSPSNSMYHDQLSDSLVIYISKTSYFIRLHEIKKGKNMESLAHLLGMRLNNTTPQQGLWLAGKDSIGIVNPFTAGLLRNMPSANDHERFVHPMRTNQEPQSQFHVNGEGKKPPGKRLCGCMISRVSFMFPTETWANRKWRLDKIRSPQTHH